MEYFKRIFVYDYKEILRIKFSEVYPNVRLRAQWNALIAAVLFAIILLGIGFIFDLRWNLYYTVFSVNTIIIGAFVLNQYVTELRIQHKHEITYNTHFAVLYPTLVLTSIILLTNGLLFFFSFNLIGNFAISFVYFGLAILPVHLTLHVQRNVTLVEPPRLVRNILFIIVLYYFSFRLIDLHSISEYYIFSTGIIVLIYLVKYLISFIPKWIHISKYLTIVSSIVLFFITVPHIEAVLMFTQSGLFDYEIEYSEVIIDETLDLTFYRDRSIRVEENEDYVFVLYYDMERTIEIRDHDFNLLKVLPDNRDSDSVFVFGNELQMTKSRTVEEEIDGETYYHRYTDVYILNDELEFELKGYAIDTKYPYYLNGKILSYDYVSSVDLSPKGKYILEHVDGVVTSITPIDEYDEYPIVYTRPNIVSFYYNNEVHFTEAYTTGYVALDHYNKDKEQTNMVTLISWDHLENDTLSNLTFTCNCLLSSLDTIDGNFLYGITTNDGAFNMRNPHYAILTEKGSLLSVSSQFSLHAVKDELYLYSRDDYSQYEFSRLVKEAPLKYYYTGAEPVVVEYVQKSLVLLILIGNYSILPASWWRNSW